MFPIFSFFCLMLFAKILFGISYFYSYFINLIVFFFNLGFNTVKNLKDLDILEVGSGRGGGLNYISNYLNPSICYGIDFSENQVF